MNKIGLSLAVAILAFGGSVVSAQEDKATKDTFSIDEITVVTATGFEQNIADAPASISVITSEEIAKSSYMSIKDVLKNLSGVNTASFADRGTDDIAIRGLPPQYTLTMINSKPVSGRESGGIFANGLNINALPPLNMIERIEVIRGPMSSLHGSDAVGGTINIITKKVSNEWTGSISSQYNIFQDRDRGDRWNTGVYVAGPIIKDVLGIELNGLVSKKSENSDGAKKFTWPDPESKSRNAGGKLSLAVTQNDRISFEYQHSTNNLLHRQNKTAWDKKGDYKKDVFTLDHEGKYDKLTLQSYLKYDKSNYFGTLTSNPAFKVGGDMKTFIFNTQGSYAFANNVLTLGVNYLDEKIDEVATGKNSRWNLAIFAEDDYFVTDDLILTLGARVNKNERYGIHFSPRVYGVYHVNDYFTLKGGISTGYINPGLVESADGAVTEGGRGAGANIGNSKVKPETSINYEVGFAYNDEKMNLSVMAFYSDFKDKIGLATVCTSTAGNMSTPHLWDCNVQGKNYLGVNTYVNLNSLYNAGVELSFDYKIMSNLKFSSNYYYIKSRHKKGKDKGKTTAQMPEHTVNMGLDYKPTDKLNVWTQVSYKNKEKPFEFYNAINYGRPSHTIADLGLVYKINNNLSINAGVYNIFNTTPKYLTSEGFWGKYGEFLDGRKFMLGFNANF